MTVAEIKEYIDEKLKRYDCKGQGYFTPIDDVNKILFDIKSMLDELEPNENTSQWVQHYEICGYVCDNCGHISEIKDNVCSNCGARMNEEVEDG